MKNDLPVLYITCYCGLARILESAVGINGEQIALPACPRCGSVINGFYSDGKIVLIEEKEG